MKKTIKKCPKAYKAFKKWLIEGLKEKYPKQDVFASDNLIELSITTSPMACTYYFDTIDMVGTLYYDNLDLVFYIHINGETIKDDEDLLKDVDRKKAEEKLIKYLFIECEKTL